MASRKTNRIRIFLSAYAVPSFLIAVALNFLSFYGTRAVYALMDRCGILVYHDLSIGPVDGYFERNAETFRWFILLYILYYIFLAGGYWILAGEERSLACSCFAAIAIGEVITAVLFLILPTTLNRPALGAEDVRTVWDWMTRIIYEADPPINLFPSLHCFNSWMVFRCSLKCPDLPKGFKLFCGVAGLGICAATLFVRQHVFADFVGAVVLAELSLFLESRLHAGKLFERLEKRIRKEV